MIHIEKDQKISENDNLRVATPTGDYDDNSLIEFYNIDKPGVVVGAFAAQYIKYGSVVYKFTDAKELGSEILLIDPQSTHNSASFVKMNNELISQMNKGNLEVDSLDKVISDQKDIVEEKREEEKEIVEEETDDTTEDTTEELPEDSGEVLGDDTSDTTEEDDSAEEVDPPVILDENTTDTEIIEDPIDDIPTEEVIPPLQEPESVTDQILGFLSNKKSKNKKVAKFVSKTKKAVKTKRRI